MADRLVVDGSGWHGTGLAQLRRMAGGGGPLPARDLRLRHGPPVALARGDRRDLRHPGLPAVPPPPPPDRGDVRRARRVRGRDDEHRQAALPRGLARVAARDAGHEAARGDDRRRGRRRRPTGAGSRAPREPERRPRRDAPPRPDATSRSSSGPVLSEMPSGHDAPGRAPRRLARLGAPGRRHRRAGGRPRPRLAGRRPRPRARVQRSAPDRRRPPGRGDRGRRARSGRGRDARSLAARARRRGGERRSRR